MQISGAVFHASFCNATVLIGVAVGDIKSLNVIDDFNSINYKGSEIRALIFIDL